MKEEFDVFMQNVSAALKKPLALHRMMPFMTGREVQSPNGERI